MSATWFIGVDAHKRKCLLTAKTSDGTLMARRSFDHTPEGWTNAFRDAPKGSKVAMECVGWYQPVFDLLESLGFVPILAHARNIALIAKSTKKTDLRDSEIICDLLRSGFLPTAHVPSKTTRELRELTRHREDVVKQQTTVKNRVHRLLERAWVPEPEVTDLFGLKGRAWLNTAAVSKAQRIVLDALMAQLAGLTDVCKTIDREIARAVQHDEDVHRLIEIDGISVIGAATLRAEIDDARRFPSRKHIRSNFGMNPSVRNSAETAHSGHITKTGPGIVRKVLVQGGIHFAKQNPHAKTKHERLAPKRGKGVARVAAGGDLLDTAYQMLKNRTRYRFAREPEARRKRRLLETMAAEGPEAISVS